jgi:hypothetical protein
MLWGIKYVVLQCSRIVTCFCTVENYWNLFWKLWYSLKLSLRRHRFISLRDFIPTSGIIKSWFMQENRQNATKSSFIWMIRGFIVSFKGNNTWSFNSSGFYSEPNVKDLPPFQRSVVSSQLLLDPLRVEMKAGHAFWTSVNCLPEDVKLHQYRCENLKSREVIHIGVKQYFKASRD